MLSFMSLISCLIIYKHWPPVFSPGWLIGSLLFTAISFAAISYWLWFIYPSLLYLNLTASGIEISNRRLLKSTKEIVSKTEIEKIIINTDSVSYILLKSHKKIHINDFLLSDLKKFKQEAEKYYKVITID